MKIQELLDLLLRIEWSGDTSLSNMDTSQPAN